MHLHSFQGWLYLVQENTIFAPFPIDLTNHFCYSDALQSIVTALYCKILIILGLAFPMAEVISDNVPKGYYQLFYVYLFLGSLLFLLIVYVDLMKTKATIAVSNTRRKSLAKRSASAAASTSQNTSSDADHVDGSTKLPRPRVHYGSFYLRLGAVCKYNKSVCQLLFVFSTCGGIRTGCKLPVLTAYFSVLA